MRPRSLRSRLTCAFTLVVALVLACAGLGLFGVALTQHSVEELVTRVQPMQLANLELRTSMSDASRGIRGYLLTGDERFLEAYDQGRSDFPRALARLRSYARPEEEPYVQQQVELTARWFALYPDVRRAGRGGQVDTARLLRGKELLDEFLTVNGTLAGELEQQQERLQQASLDLRAVMVLVLAFVAVLAGGVAVLTGLRTSRAVVAPLLQLRDTLARLTAGDGGARAALDRDAPAEVGALAASVNALAEEGQRLRRADAERVRSGELARELGLRIREHLVVETLLAEAVEAVGRVLGADWAYVRLLREGRIADVEHQWHAPGVAPLPPSAGETEADGLPWLHQLHGGGRAYVIDDTAAELAFGGPPGTGADAGGVGACVLAPLAAGTDLYGCSPWPGHRSTSGASPRPPWWRPLPATWAEPCSTGTSSSSSGSWSSSCASSIGRRATSSRRCRTSCAPP